MLSVRADFPIFETYPDLVYLDSAATTQKPQAVIEAVTTFYTSDNANIHRGLYPLAIQSTESYENARQKIASFLEAGSEKEVIFTRNATEGLNLLAATLSQSWKEGDSVIISELEHHSNLVPWQEATGQKKLQLKFVRITKEGQIDLEHLESLIDQSTRVVALSHCSNVLGSITPVNQVRKILNRQGREILLILDASQSVGHFPVSVQELGCDFLVFSGHKVYGPSGIGILWGKEALLATLPPYQTGGEMILTVTTEKASWKELPGKFEAGTPNLEGAVGLGAAIDFLQTISLQKISRHLSTLSSYAQKKLAEIPQVSLIGNPNPKSGIISFRVTDIHPHDLAELLGGKAICIRAGHHCAQPLHQALQIDSSNRISLAVYNNRKDIDRFISALQEIIIDFSHV